MKQFAAFILTLAILSACAPVAPTPPLAGVRPATIPHIVYPVRSVYEVVYPKGYKPAAYTLNGNCSLTRGPNGIVTGCEISGGSASPYYKQAAFYLHTKPNGNGCTIAAGHFHGQTYAGQIIPIAFYWLKNTCYPNVPGRHR